MFEKICWIKEKNKINEIDFIHVISIILRCYSEIEYMQNKNKYLNNFTLNQMKNFKIEKCYERINFTFNSETLVLSNVELNILVEEIYSFLEKNYPIGYNYKLIDPIYMSLFLYEFIPRITNTKVDEIEVNDFMLLRKNSNPVPLECSESYKALQKGECVIYTPFNSNHLIDSDYDRLMETLSSIKKNGYPYLGKYIILYNDEPYIRDGQHRASVIKYLYGNIKIPVLRIYIDGDLNDD